MSLSLPALNAVLNTASGLLVAVGYFCIRRKEISRHQTLMTAAFVVSSLFLASYLYHHYQVGSVRYQGAGWMRTAYFSILLTHTILAAAIVPLILRTFFLAFRDRVEEHRRLARWTMPLWIYVSVTGVVIYAMLY